MKYRMVIENKDGTVCLENSKQRYTPEEFEKLKALMPGVGWIRFAIVRPEQITNDKYVPWDENNPKHPDYKKLENLN